MSYTTSVKAKTNVVGAQKLKAQVILNRFWLPIDVVSLLLSSMRPLSIGT